MNCHCILKFHSDYIAVVSYKLQRFSLIFEILSVKNVQIDVCIKKVVFVEF